MRRRILEWDRRGKAASTVHFDTKGRFEIRPVTYRDRPMYALFVHAKEGGPGFEGRVIARYETVADAKEACLVSSYPKDHIIHRDLRPRRPYNWKTPKGIARSKAGKAAKAAERAARKAERSAARAAAKAPAKVTKTVIEPTAKTRGRKAAAPVKAKATKKAPVKTAAKAPVKAKATKKAGEEESVAPAKATKAPAKPKAKATKRTAKKTPQPTITIPDAAVAEAEATAAAPASKAPARRLRVPGVKTAKAGGETKTAEVINFPANGGAASQTEEASPPDAPETVAAQG